MSTMNRTRNDLPEVTRKKAIRLLNTSLADAIHLALQAKQAHWNVKGATFQPLHELFDSLYEQASGWSDLLAERAVQLGGTAEGTLALVTAGTRLPAYKPDATEGKDHLVLLSTSVAAFGKSVRGAIDTADKAGDAGTADLFTEISRGADKMLWFLEAHLQ